MAQSTSSPTDEFFGAASVRVDDSVLSAMRGGFDLPGGLRVSFAVERSVSIGDASVANTTINLASTLGVVTSSVLANAVQTAVQNAVDGQKIQAVTTIDITTNSLQMMKLGNVQALVGTYLPATLQR